MRLSRFIQILNENTIEPRRLPIYAGRGLNEGRVETIPVFKRSAQLFYNPSRDQLVGLLNKSTKSEYEQCLRGILIDPENVVVWAGSEAIHWNVQMHLNGGTSHTGEFYYFPDRSTGFNDLRPEEKNAPAILRLKRVLTAAHDMYDASLNESVEIIHGIKVYINPSRQQILGLIPRIGTLRGSSYLGYNGKPGLYWVFAAEDSDHHEIRMQMYPDDLPDDQRITDFAVCSSFDIEDWYGSDSRAVLQIDPRDRISLVCNRHQQDQLQAQPGIRQWLRKGLSETLPESTLLETQRTVWVNPTPGMHFEPYRLPVLVNPSRDELDAFISQHPQGDIRALDDERVLYVWRSNQAIHYYMTHALNLIPADEENRLHSMQVIVEPRTNLAYVYHFDTTTSPHQNGARFWRSNPRLQRALNGYKVQFGT